jgi:hypothetical protein
MTKQLRAGWRAGRVLAAAAVTVAAVLLVRRIRSVRRDHRRQARALTRRPGPVTQSLAPVSPADTWLGDPRRNLEHRLDEALKETFPASDSIAIHIE